MKKTSQIAIILLVFFLITILNACEIRKSLDLPEIKQLKLDMIAAAPSIGSVTVDYGNDLSPVFTVHGYEISQEDAQAVVEKARELFSDENFHDTFFAGLGMERTKEEVAEAGPPAGPRIKILMFDSALTGQAFGRLKYSYSSHYFVVENGWETDEVDGYATWWGGLVNQDEDPLAED